MSYQGWIKVPRSIMDSAIWPQNKEFSYFEFYIYLKMRANFNPTKAYWGGELVEIYRGQVATSVENLSKASKRSSKWIRKRIKDFEKLGLIKHEKRHTHFTLLTICDYDSYEGLETAEGIHKGIPKGSPEGISDGIQYNNVKKGNNNGKNEKKIKGKYEKFVNTAR